MRRGQGRAGQVGFSGRMEGRDWKGWNLKGGGLKGWKARQVGSFSGRLFQ